MDNQTFIFIYAKDGKIKSLTLEEAKKVEKTLQKDGWKHVQTLDACTFLDYLYNECDDNEKIIELKQLVKIS